MKKDEVKQQSLNAYNQWCEQWREHAKHNSKHTQKPLADFENIGVGKACVLVGNGASFETEIETLKKYKDKVDIICCDKTLGHLIDNGIKPTFCMVCDANVNYEKYMKPWEDQLDETVMFSNVCGNPEWGDNGNWKDKYFFVNEDVLQSEKEFSELSGCKNTIPAATNVSNAMVVFLTQCDNKARRNHFGYDKYLLIGYDYCWLAGGSYYAFDYDGGGKRNYMRHQYLYDFQNNMAYTSNNLHFSARWLDNYINVFKLPVIQCGKSTVLPLKHQGDLESQMQYDFKRDDKELVQDLVKQYRFLKQRTKSIERSLDKISKEHEASMRASV